MNRNNKPELKDSMTALKTMSLDLAGEAVEVAAKALYAAKKNPATVGIGLGSAMLINKGIEEDSAILTGLGVIGGIYTATQLPDLIDDFNSFNSLDYNAGLLDLDEEDEEVQNPENQQNPEAK